MTVSETYQLEQEVVKLQSHIDDLEKQNETLKEIIKGYDKDV